MILSPLFVLLWVLRVGGGMRLLSKVEKKPAVLGKRWRAKKGSVLR